MQIKEIIQESSKSLFERLDRDNDTGFLTEDLVRIVKAHRAGPCSEPKSYEDFMAEMDSWEND